jgi:N-acetylneuraminic acid mutarotase
MKPDSAPGKSDGVTAYDASSDCVIYFAGAFTESGEHDDFKAGSETWAYDFGTNTWTNLEPSKAPANLKGASMVYDAESDRMILFGGWATNLSGDGSNETWAFDYETNTWTKMDPEIRPPSRYYHAMAYDTESDRVILWGGYGPKPIDVSSVWAYDYNTNTWEELISDTAPEPVGYGAMVYDPVVDLTFLYAGKELWSFNFNSNTWHQVSDSPTPGDLLFLDMVFVDSTGQVIIFGGGPNLNIHFNKTWSYNPQSDSWTNQN